MILDDCVTLTEVVLGVKPGTCCDLWARSGSGPGSDSEVGRGVLQSNSHSSTVWWFCRFPEQPRQWGSPSGDRRSRSPHLQTHKHTSWATGLCVHQSGSHWDRPVVYDGDKRTGTCSETRRPVCRLGGAAGHGRLEAVQRTKDAVRVPPVCPCSFWTISLVWRFQMYTILSSEPDTIHWNPEIKG